MHSKASVALSSQACPLCGGEESEEIFCFDDGVRVADCRTCGLTYTPTRHADPSSLFKHSDSGHLELLYEPIISGRKEYFRHDNFLEYLSLVLAAKQATSLLDIGCAHGFFLAEARKAGLTTTGVEPSPSMARFAREQLGLEVIDGRLLDADLGTRRWDAVSFTDSFEYIPDPLQNLAKVRAHLAPGGVLFIKVPNGAYFHFRHMLKTRFGVDTGGAGPFTPSLRVVHYRLQTLRAMVEKAGFEILRAGATTPVDSPPWKALTGMFLEVKPPWYIGFWGRQARTALRGLGRLEELCAGRDDLSPSIYVVARTAPE